MKELTDRRTGIGVRISATGGGNEKAAFLFTGSAHLRLVIESVAKNVAHFSGQILEQVRGDDVVGDIGCSQTRGQGNPKGSGAADEMQLPAIPPAMIARLAPVCLGINRRVRHDASFTVFLVPDAALSTQGS